jgi:hypothetical protein
MSSITKPLTARADGDGLENSSRFAQATVAQFALKWIFICRLSFKILKKKKI